MKYGFIFAYGDARTTADLAHEAEEAGWDGFFVWEPWGASMPGIPGSRGHAHPLSRMRPWKLASETATLDNLSKGRVILAVGLGADEVPRLSPSRMISN